MQVYALVGPAGTGKSHRAVAVAHDHQIDLIIDDGLLIKGSRILAGYSAKREATRVAAVRRAIFHDPIHREEARSVIQQIKPQRVLILGTSTAMVDRIVQALGLPSPKHVLHIEDIATPEEIRQARRNRRQFGKHVVPAPTFEVKKGFSGYLVDPLRLFYRSKSSRVPLTFEKSVLRPTFSSLGRFYISENVVAAIAERAATEVTGVQQVGRVLVESSPAGVTISMDLVVRYGIAIDECLRHVQRHVATAVDHMTALHVLRVDVTAKGLAFVEAANMNFVPGDEKPLNLADTDEKLDYNEA